MSIDKKKQGKAEDKNKKDNIRTPNPPQRMDPLKKWNDQEEDRSKRSNNQHR